MVFDYHSFHRGEVCSRISWRYIGANCEPILFTLQGFKLEELLTDQLDTPTVLLTSTSPAFTLLSDYFSGVNEPLYFRVFGVDVDGDICYRNSLATYYNFTTLVISGK